MTTLRELFEIYPLDARGTLPLALRVDDAVFAYLDASDPVTGELPSGAVEQMRAAMGKLTHVIASAGGDLDDLVWVKAYRSSSSDMTEIGRIWQDAVANATRSLHFEMQEAALSPGQEAVLVAGMNIDGLGNDPGAAGISDSLPAPAGMLGPVFFAPFVTAASPEDGRLPEGIEAQVGGAFDNLNRLLTAANVPQGQLLRIAGYMQDLKDKDLLNEAMVQRFPEWSQKPVHKYVPTGLPPGVEFGLQAIAVTGAPRHILEIDGIKHNDPISLGAQVGNVFVSSRVQARLESDARAQTKRLIESHAGRLVESIGGELDDLIQMVWGIGDPAFEAEVRDECAQHWEPDRMPRLDVMHANFPHSPLPRLEFFALLARG